jgi:hypothetical protein
MSRRAISAFVGSVLIGAAFASPAIAGDDSETRFVDQGVYSSSVQAGTASANYIVGTGAKKNYIVGTGAKKNYIVGTGAKKNYIVGTGAKKNYIVGTGAKKNYIVGTGAKRK